ncbi:MAG: winged helix-turn-helix domain-containing protein [Acidobacteria bacterium]|nr:winged helix-turn-helix domain-containing protein [Acidobacteriota bacterium]
MEDKKIDGYEFGAFRLDVRRRALTKNDEKIPLSARNFDLLLFMLENSGRILEHDELLDRVWAGTFVEQSTLKKGVSALRQILGETPETEFIKTIPRRGYSFVSPVRPVAAENGEYLYRETEREIVVEEYEETDDEPGAPPSAQISALPVSVNQTKKNKYLRPLILTGVGLLAATAAFFGLRPFFAKNAARQFSAENVRLTRITNSGKVISGTAASPDGSYILYPSVEKNGVVLWLRQISANSATRLTPPLSGSFWGFAFAPDNSYVYYIFNNAAEPAKSGLYKVPLLGGEPQRIAENVSSLAVSPDGKRIAVVRLGEKTEIIGLDPNGENARTIATLPDNTRLWGISWSPDNAGLLCTVRKIVDDKFLFYISEIAVENGRETVVLPPQEKSVFGAAWLPDKSGMLLTMREANADIRQIWQYFPASQEWRRVTNDNNSYKLVSLTRDGKSIIATQESGLDAIWISDDPFPQNGSGKKTAPVRRENFRQLTDGLGSFHQLEWLADGRLMYSETEDAREKIFTINADGSGARAVTNGDDGIWIIPSVGGGGRSICFLSSKTGAKQIWRIDPDGKNPTKLTAVERGVLSGRILRDNATVIYNAQLGSDDNVLFRQTPDGQTAQLTEGDTGDWAVSPDESLLAAVVRDRSSGKYRVEVKTLADGKTIRAFDFQPMRQLVFTPDGKSLAYDVVADDVGQIMIQPLDGEPYPLTEFQTDNIFGFGWSPDGAKFAVIRGRQLNDAVLIRADER